MIKLPEVDVVFRGLADSVVYRSTRGIACIILKDNTGTLEDVPEEENQEENQGNINGAEEESKDNADVNADALKQETEEENQDIKVLFEYKSFKDVKKDDYTDENYKIIQDIFLEKVSKLYVIKISDGKSFNNIQHLISKDINWITFISEAPEDQKTIAKFVKEENKTRTKRLKALCYNLQEEDANDMHIINFTNKFVIKTDNTKLAGYKYLSRLLGVLTACPMDTSVTYIILKDLKQVNQIGDINTINDAINKGKFILINDDDGVRIARGINSLQKNDVNHTDDMKYITIVEAMDLMYEDIVKTFKKSYLGKFKNSYDNQVLFISAINSYFRELAKQDILDQNHKNVVFVDIEKQREMWLQNGVTQAEHWNDIEVKEKTFRTNVYLQANVKFLNAMEDLFFIVNM